MRQRANSEWRFVVYAALAMVLAAGLVMAFSAGVGGAADRPLRSPTATSGQAGGLSYQRRVLEPVRQAEPGKPRAVAGGEWEVLPPVRYENLSVFPVVARAEFDTTGFLTLDEGLESGEVLVTERGSALMRRDRGYVHPTRGQRDAGDTAQSRRVTQGGATVNTLVLVNRSKRPLLLLAGEVVTGGKQDRIIGKDRIVAPGAEPLPLDVFCVERGAMVGGQ